MTIFHILEASVLGLQVVAAAALLRRLGRGRPRLLSAAPPAADARAITIVIPARNEARRIRRCVAGAVMQGGEVSEILIVDDESEDETAAVARAAGDARLRVIRGAPPPPGWTGKSWALEQGLRAVKTEWALCLDADARPIRGLAAALLTDARASGVDALSAGPRFLVETAGERWLHPALLTTLIYRLGGGEPAAGRRRFVNGQCMLLRTETLRRAGGFAAASTAFADDFALADALARMGVRLVFRDGAKFLEVKMYGSGRETWREWGRTLALNEVTTPVRQIQDVAFLALTQAAPLPLLALLGFAWRDAGFVDAALLTVNGLLLSIRIAVLCAAAHCYRPARGFYWLSPLADPLAVVRIALSALWPRREWRGRRYASGRETA